MHDKVEVSSMMERLGYKRGGNFGTKEEATLNIEPLRLHIEQLRETHSGSGGGGSGRSVSHTKVYSAATRNTKRSGGRNEVVTKAGFAARKRSLGTEHPKVKKQKLPKSLQASVRVLRAEKFAQVKAAACRKLGQWW